MESNYEFVNPESEPEQELNTEEPSEQVPEPETFEPDNSPQEIQETQKVSFFSLRDPSGLFGLSKLSFILIGLVITLLLAFVSIKMEFINNPFAQSNTSSVSTSKTGSSTSKKLSSKFFSPPSSPDSFYSPKHYKSSRSKCKVI